MNHPAPLTAANLLRTAQAAYETGAAYPMTGEERLFTFRDLFRVLRVRWRVILTVGLLFAVLGLLAVSLIAPVYVGTALVIVDEQQSHVFNQQTDPSVLSDLPTDPSSIESQVQMLQSHALAGQVVDTLKLAQDPEFNGTQPNLMGTILNIVPGLIDRVGRNISGPAARPRSDLTAAQARRERTISKFLADLDVQVVGRSTMVEIDFRSMSPGKAARIADAIANTYIDNLTAAKVNASETASRWLADRVGQLARQQGAADAAVQQYKAENGLIDTSNGAPMTDRQLDELTRQLIQAQGNEAEARAKLARVKQLVQSGHSADVTAVVDSPLITQLRQQETALLQQKAALSSTYGPLHPSMQNVEQQIRELQAKISEEVDRVVGTVSNDVSVAGAHVAALKSGMAQATSYATGQNQARVKLAGLEANAASARALYQSYLDRLKQTQQQASLRIPDVHLASPAAVPLAPVSPKKLLIVAGAGFAGIVAGFLAVLLMDHMSGGFRSAGELEAALGVPVLATIPEWGSRWRKLRDVGIQVVRNPHSQFSEAVRGLEIGLCLHTGESPADGMVAGKVILVTSALPSEGKTSTVVNLARRLAMSGHKVVVVDADLRRPQISAALGLRKSRYSLSDYLARRCTLDEALRPDPRSPLVALTASPMADAPELIRSGAMTALIARLRGIADFVLIDSPPLLAVNDAKLLAKITDSAIFVVRWEKTSREAVSFAVKILREFHIQLTGAVLTRADAKQHQYYAFGYNGISAVANYYNS